MLIGPLGGPVLRAPGWTFDAGLYEVLLLVGGIVVLVGAVVLSVQRGRPFSAALVYLTAGVVIGLGLRAVGISWYDPVENGELFSRAAEFAVIVSLFGAGVKLDRPLTWRAWRVTALLLVVAMPLTIAGVALLGTWLLGMSLPVALLLGAVLAPTDPVLADDVQVGGPMQDEPEDEPRFAITAEAGMNDGLAFPFVMLALTGFERGFGQLGEWGLEWLSADLVYPIVVGVLIGAVAGRLIAAATYRVLDRGWLANPFDAFVAIGAIFAVYGATELVEAYGFLAVFAAGVAFRRYEERNEVNRRLHEVTLVIEKLGELSVLLLLGSVLPIGGVLELGPQVLLIGIGLIVLVRPLAVLISLLPTRLPFRERLFIGWFGIKGIGSIYYLGFAFAALTPPDAGPLFSATAIAILLSVAVHGLTSSWLTRRLIAARAG
ncbi:MAG TPA: cation:proton antiporter [Candidatus Limnocylindria bacterium]|nr:cation:proton antiporter [Candidatus Limnocylindria bacterium]